MASTIAWLDFSEDDQRRAREIIALFSQQESRDELGIGTVRDALSDELFPGISVTQARSREEPRHPPAPRRLPFQKPADEG